jgi:hypothetical protein
VFSGAFPREIRFLAAVLLVLCAACAGPTQHRFVLADDLNTRLLQYLPELEKMFPARGLALQMTVPTPVCAPSRATILTGKYAHNDGVKNNGFRAGGIWAFRAKGKDTSRARCRSGCARPATAPVSSARI